MPKFVPPPLWALNQSMTQRDRRAALKKAQQDAHDKRVWALNRAGIPTDMLASRPDPDAPKPVAAEPVSLEQRLKARLAGFAEEDKLRLAYPNAFAPAVAPDPEGN
jgi:hypothetical protein